MRTHVADLPTERLVALYLFVPVDDHLSATVERLQALTRDPALGGSLTGLPLLERELTALSPSICCASVWPQSPPSCSFACALLSPAAPDAGRPLAAVGGLVAVRGGAGALSIPLNLYNLIAIPLCIGYGIDDHIFLVHRHEATDLSQRSRSACWPRPAAPSSLTTLATVAGFAG